MSQANQLDVGITKHFRGAARDFLLDVRFTVAQEVVAVFGPSGAGKTTILECISGLQKPDQGRVSLCSRVLFDSNAEANLAARERRVGYIFQNLALFPHLTARQNIGFGLRQLASKERLQRISEALESLRIAHVAERLPSQMSGGEKQRVALARSLVTKPDALLLDEPMSALDYATKGAILRDLRSWHDSHPIPLIYVTHAIDEVFTVADRVIKLADGKIVAQGKPDEILGVEREQLIKNLLATR